MVVILYNSRLFIVTPTDDPDRGPGNQDGDHDEPEPLAGFQAHITRFDQEQDDHTQRQDNPSGQVWMFTYPLLQ